MAKKKSITKKKPGRKKSTGKKAPAKPRAGTEAKPAAAHEIEAPLEFLDELLRIDAEISEAEAEHEKLKERAKEAKDRADEKAAEIRGLRAELRDRVHDRRVGQASLFTKGSDGEMKPTESASNGSDPRHDPGHDPGREIEAKPEPGTDAEPPDVAGKIGPAARDPIDANSGPEHAWRERSIELLGLPKRTTKLLIDAGIDTLEDLARATIVDPDGLDVKGLGIKSTDAIFEAWGDLRRNRDVNMPPLWGPFIGMRARQIITGKIAKITDDYTNDEPPSLGLDIEGVAGKVKIARVDFIDHYVLLDPSEADGDADSADRS